MDLIFRNARLIDPETQTDDIGSLRVTDGRIAGRGARQKCFLGVERIAGKHGGIEQNEGHGIR